jgi:hypothetical protein
MEFVTGLIDSTSVSDIQQTPSKGRIWRTSGVSENVRGTSSVEAGAHLTEFEESGF